MLKLQLLFSYSFNEVAGRYCGWSQVMLNPLSPALYPFFNPPPFPLLFD